MAGRSTPALNTATMTMSAYLPKPLLETVAGGNFLARPDVVGVPGVGHGEIDPGQVGTGADDLGRGVCGVGRPPRRRRRRLGSGGYRYADGIGSASSRTMSGTSARARG